MNMTQQELGDRLGVNKDAVSKWENGAVSNIKRGTIEAIANIFGVSPVWIMGLDTDESEKIESKKKDMVLFELQMQRAKVVTLAEKLREEEAILSDLERKYKKIEELSEKKKEMLNQMIDSVLNMLSEDDE